MSGALDRAGRDAARRGRRCSRDAVADADGPGARRARGGRPRARPRGYALLVEAIREGYLLHYGAAARCSARRPRPARCWPATALRARPRRLAELGDLEAVAELADVISLSRPGARRGRRRAGARRRLGRAARGRWHGRRAEQAARPPQAAGRRRAPRSRSRRSVRHVQSPRRRTIVPTTRGRPPPRPTTKSQATPPTAASPGAFEGETVTRRRFIRAAHGARAAIADAAFVLPGARLRARARSSRTRRPSAGRTSAPRTTSPTTPTSRG